MNVDVSPDGRTIAFDLLGDIYTMPIAGGTPRRISSGLAFDMQPRFSPERAADRLHLGPRRRRQYLGDEHGRHRRAPDHPRDLPPAQRADLEPGRPIYRRAQAFHDAALARHRRDLALPRLRRRRRRRLWSSGPIRSSRRSLASRPSRPTASPSISAATPRPATHFEYAQDSNQQVFAIERYDMATGERSTIAGGPGGAVRPTPSPDGRWLAFVHRTGGHRRLFVQRPALRRAAAGLCRSRPGSAGDLGGARRLSEHGLDAGQQHHRLLGGRPDPAGEPRRLGAAPKFPSRSPTTASSSIRRGPRSTPPRRPSPPGCRASPSVSPDGRRVVFETLGRLYIRDVGGGGAPRLLTAQRRRLPALPGLVARRQPDRLRLLERPAARRNQDGQCRRLRHADGHADSPAITAARVSRRTAASSSIEASGGAGPDLQPLVGGDRHLPRVRQRRRPRRASSPTAATPSSAAPRTGSSSRSNEQQKRKLISVDLNGGNRRDHAQGEMVTGYELSPDGRTLAFRENYNLYATPFFGGARVLELSARATQLPLVRVTTGGANYPCMGGQPAELDDGADALQRQPGCPAAPAYTPPATGTSLAVTVPADVPTGWTALVGARVVTMANDAGRDHRRRRHPDRGQPHPRGRPARARSRSRPARAPSTSPARPSSPA